MDNAIKNLLNKARESDIWELGNGYLYSLCRDHYYHKADNEIAAKIWLIGRSYSASVERRKNKKSNEKNDNFYKLIVVPALKNSILDSYLINLKRFSSINLNNVYYIIETHGYLTKVLNKITAMDKRSLSSKYLHFHCPRLFYIYDSRAVKGLRILKKKLQNKLKNKILKDKKYDKEYSRFYMACLDIHKEIITKYKIRLSIRQFDNLLISIADNN